MESTLLISLRRENQLLTAIGLAVLTVVLTFASFNIFGFTESLSQEFLLVLVILFILLVTAQLYFVHTVLISQLGLVYISNKREKIIPWEEIGSVEIIGQENQQRHKRLILKNKNGKLLRGFPVQLLQIDIHQAAELIKARI